MKFKIRLFITLTLVFFLPSAFALCTGDNSMLKNYDGTIGNKYKVRATMTIEGNNIDGVYFYHTQLKDIAIKGKIIDGKRILINELDSTGKGNRTI